jgi:hypothetical protein
MLTVVRALGVSALLALPLPGYAATDSTAAAIAVKTNPPLAPEVLDSPAQTAIRKLKSPDANTKPVRVAAAEIAHPDLVTRLDEIRVYGRNEPEDFARPKKPPHLQFRDHLASASPPMTPWQKIRLPLCLIGLCGNYGPEGIPLGDSAERRAEDRLGRTTLQSNGQFYGIVQ